MHTVLLPAVLWSVAHRAAMNSPCRTYMGKFAVNLVKLLERWNVSPSLFSALLCEYKSPVFRNTQPSCLRTDGQLVLAEGFSPWLVGSGSNAQLFPTAGLKLFPEE